MIRRVLLLLVASAITALAQESPAPKSVRITFVPPPLDGTLSLGIYDSSGRLVRVLHREADIADFEVGQDALSTTWDGKNDADEAMPPGKYRARGYAVAELAVEGIGFFFNDWIEDEESPRVRKITSISVKDNALIVSATADNTTIFLKCDESGKIVDSVESGAGEPAKTSLGRDRTVWLVDERDSEVAIRQLSANREPIRQLKIPPNEPHPVAIAASPTEDRIFLLEEDQTRQRVRALRLLASKQEGEQAVSDWKVEFEKQIVKHKDFTIADGKPVLSAGKASPEKLAVKLQPNPLKKDAREPVELTVGFDADGSDLKTSDGLPLLSISDTSNLTRVVLSPRNGNSLDIFQDDDAVVEQFRVNGLDQMMSFDAGEIELK